MTKYLKMTDKARSVINGETELDTDNTTTIQAMRDQYEDGLSDMTDTQINDIINESAIQSMKALDRLSTWSNSSSYQAICALEALQYDILINQDRNETAEKVRGGFTALRSYLVEEDLRESVMQMEPSSSIQDSVEIGNKNFRMYVENLEGITLPKLMELIMLEYNKGLQDDVREDAIKLIQAIAEICKPKEI